MQDVKPQTLVETFEQANYNSIPEYNVSLITLLTYPVNMHSWAYLQRYEETANYFTKNVIDIDGVITDFPGLKGAHLARLRPWWPHCFNLPETVRTLPIVFIYRKWPADKRKRWHFISQTRNLKNFWGSMPPAAPLVWGALGSLTFLPLRAPSKSHLKFVIVKRGGTIFICNYFGGVQFWYTTLLHFSEPPLPPPPLGRNKRTVPNKSHLGKLFARHTDLYRIYSINRPGRLLHFWTLRVGAYSRLGAY